MRWSCRHLAANTTPSGRYRLTLVFPCGKRAPLVPRLGVTAEVDLTDDEIVAILLAADNPKPFLDDDEIAAVVLAAAA